MSTTIALIPARAGSKGILNKNIKCIAGKPLIAWSIEQALASACIDEVFVSTDSEEIAEISKRYGASVPFIRPDDISSDESSTESVMLHFVNWMSSVGVKADNIVLIQATSPIRHSFSFDDAITQFIDSGANSMVTVVPTHRFFWENLKAPEAKYDYFNRPRRQDIPKDRLTYVETGSFYITRVKDLVESKSRLCGSVEMYIMQEEEAYEIDSMVDFIVCESILNNFLGKM